MRLSVAEETLRAIRTGEVDAVVISGKKGPQVFTLEGADHAYRTLIESMNEGALTLTSSKTILYANQCFARMVKCPLTQVTGSSLNRFLSAEDRAAIRPLLKQEDKAGSKIQAQLIGIDGSRMPVQISTRRLLTVGDSRAVIGMVVTDMTQARHNEEMLRALSQSLVQAHEAERGSVALDLHDNITQLLCAVLFRNQALLDKLSTRDVPSKREAIELRKMLGRTAAEVQRISSNLRPSLLDHLGLAAVLRHTSTEFAHRTGLRVKLDCSELAIQLPAGTELTLFRIFQEALKNVELHAHARHVTVSLGLQDKLVKLAIKDDGVGFALDRGRAKPRSMTALGLLGMRERASYVGGSLKVTSVHHVGTEIEVRVPLHQASQ
jgi:PAS domain S-box-containing protein